ncbi:oligosaccharide flippase family protein [Aestuariivirga sp.]|uniref:oligosaccharide flippase family protein n=1 Tax=Aestuariivirga sp. TaxID=2650926 RepID=UPI003BAA4C26
MTYRQILRSTGITGTSQVIVYAISILRVKFVAVLLGPEGVGLVGLYNSTVDLVANLSSMGINQSGVRAIASTGGDKTSLSYNTTVITIYRLSIILGLSGTILTASLSTLLSNSIFGNAEHATAIQFLSFAVFLNVISGAFLATLQGNQRIFTLAKVNIIGAAITTFATIILYSLLGPKGIVPVILSAAMIAAATSAICARDQMPSQQHVNWRTTAEDGITLLKFGTSLIYGTILSIIAGLIIRATITHRLGLDSNGIYLAACGVSGLFSSFIVSAIAVDFYPRLSRAIGDHDQLNRLVSEQIEMGLLLATPGLIATCMLAHNLIALFYSESFTAAEALIPWLVAGSLLQIFFFPIGYLQRAKASSRWVFISQTEANFGLVLFSVLLIDKFGLMGAGYALVIHMIVHGLTIMVIADRLTRFRPSLGVLKVTLGAGFLFTGALILQATLSGTMYIITSLAIMTATSAWTLRGVASKVLNEQDTIVRNFPILKYLLLS